MDELVLTQAVSLVVDDDATLIDILFGLRNATGNQEGDQQIETAPKVHGSTPRPLLGSDPRHPALLIQVLQAARH